MIVMVNETVVSSCHKINYLDEMFFHVMKNDGFFENYQKLSKIISIFQYFVIMPSFKWLE